MKHLLLTTIAAVLVVGCGLGQDPEGALRSAALDGNIEAVKRHLAAGANVNAPNTYGWTALYWASSRGHKEIVELLIANGADVNQTSDRGDTPLDGAIDPHPTLDPQPEIADLLRKHGGKTSAGLSIYVAATQGNIEAVKQHLASGTEVDARDRQDKTPLQHAVFWGNKEIVKLLIAKGADVNAKNSTGSTPLDYAKRHPEIADLLRKNGGKSGAEDSIHLASKLGNIEAVKKHLDSGTDVNAMDNRGRTPLRNAAEYGHKEIAELLIAKGADVNARKMNGWTPLDNAIKRKHPEIADLLRKHGGKTSEELKAEGK
jgi:ankyrin repeat protein